MMGRRLISSLLLHCQKIMDGGHGGIGGNNDDDDDHSTTGAGGGGDDDDSQQTLLTTDISRLIIFSYVAGMVTMAIIVVLRRWFTKNIPDNLNFMNDDDTMTWIDPWNVPSNLLSRIGETITFRGGSGGGGGVGVIGRPRQKHWPWETIRQRLSFVTNENENINEDDDGSDADSGNRKSGKDGADEHGLEDDDGDDDDDDGGGGTNNAISSPNKKKKKNQLGQNRRNSPNVNSSSIGGRKNNNSIFPNDSDDEQRLTGNNDDDDISTIESSIGDDADDNDPLRYSADPADSKNNSTGASRSDGGTGSKMKKEKSLCIGSIFGLDVGGTLAKLVYFEQKPSELDPLQGSSRERNYAQAASARAVINARVAAGKRQQQQHVFASHPDNDMQHEDASSSSEQHPLHVPPKSPSRSTTERSTSTSSYPGNATLSPSNYLQRRRSLSVGFMNRQKDLYKEKLAEEQQEQTKKNRTEHQSEKDLAQLYTVRQESLPDDVRHFRHSVDFREIDDEELRAMLNDEILESKSDDGDYNDAAGADDSAAKPKRSTSMFDLSSHSKMQQKAEALNRFYNFAKRRDAEESLRDHKLSFYSRELGGEFHFVRFETRHMQNAMDLIRYNNLHLHICDVGATGGGAHKFSDAWEEQLGIRIDKQEELDSQVAGMQFVLSTVVGECYTFRPVNRGGSMPSRTSSSSTADANNVSSENIKNVGLGLSVESISESDMSDRVRMDSDENRSNCSTSEENESNIGIGDSNNKVDDWWWSRKVQRDAISYSSAYPYIVVTIGTGVSILRVDGPRKHERISGSTIGGGTYWGLMRLLTDVETFEDAMKRAEMGDPCKVDMMVGDIYGKNSNALEKLGLPAHVVASSFGKLVAKEFPAEGLTQEDLARALLLMVTNNIGLVAYLNAKTVKTSRIYFVGSFLSQNMISQRRLSFAIDFWSKGEMEALFLEHEGYFGALGAFLLSQNIEEQEEGFGFHWESNPNNHVATQGLSGKSKTFLGRKQHTFGA